MNDKKGVIVFELTVELTVADVLFQAFENDILAR